MVRNANFQRIIFIYACLLFILCGLARLTHANVDIAEGIASAGADFACSPVLGELPNSFDLNVFYEEADLTIRPSGSTNNRHGWGRASWNVSVGDNAHIIQRGKYRRFQ